MSCISCLPVHTSQVMSYNSHEGYYSRFVHNKMIRRGFVFITAFGFDHNLKHY